MSPEDKINAFEGLTSAEDKRKIHLSKQYGWRMSEVESVCKLVGQVGQAGKPADPEADPEPPLSPVGA